MTSVPAEHPVGAARHPPSQLLKFIKKGKEGVGYDGYEVRRVWGTKGMRGMKHEKKKYL